MLNLKNLALTLVMVFSATVVNAAIIVDVYEQGNDVIFDYSGTVDLKSTLFKEADRNFIVQDVHSNFFRSLSSPTDDYGINFTQQDIFAGKHTSATAQFGDSLLIEGAGFNQIWLPDLYKSGDLLAGSLVFGGQSFASMLLSMGTFTWAWENGQYSDFVEFRMSNLSPVPVPAAAWLFGSALLGFVGFSRKRKVS